MKPSNVLLTGGADRGVVVADLRMAKRPAESTGVTMTVGTPAYMAPEQAHQRSGLDVRAVAAVTYLLLTGHQPFHERTASEVALQVAARTPSGSIGPVHDTAEDTVARTLDTPRDRGRPALAALAVALGVAAVTWVVLSALLG